MNRKVHSIEKGKVLKGTKTISKAFLFSVLFTLFSTFQAFSQLNVTIDAVDPWCYGGFMGSITATAFGGTAPYGYSWSTGETGPSITGLTAGTYSLTVTDAAGGNIVRSIFLDQPDRLDITFTSDICVIPFTLTAIGSGGVGPYEYNWSNGENTSTITNLNPGVYCVTMVDFNGCGRVACDTLVGTPLSVSVGTDAVTCHDGTDGTLTAFPNGGTPPYIFQWSNGFFGQTIANLSPGNYTVTLTDVNGCSDSATGIVANAPEIIVVPSVVNPQCLGDSNGSISLNVSGGNPPYTYFWSNGAFTSSISNLTQGTYIVTVTDANNCPVTVPITLSNQSNLSIQAFPTHETCPGFNDGFLTVVQTDGVWPFTYLWSNGATTQVVTNVTPGTYSVTLTDATGCTATATTTVLAADPFNISVTGTNTTTCGIANGTATANVLTGNAPFSYVWSNGGVTQSITNLSAGTYTVTVTNGDGCTTIGSVTITSPPEVFVSINSTPSVCEGDNSGIATAMPIGGTAPFTYSWNNGGNTQTITGLTSGMYIVTVTDAVGCTATSTTFINQSPGLTVNAVGNNIVCGVGNSGSATAMVQGGTAPYSYLWSTGAVSSTIAGLGTGTYSVTVSDALGCSNTDQINILVVDDLDATFTTSSPGCNGESTGSATVFATGGTQPYIYQWSNGGNTPTINNIPAGTHSVTITEANGCQIVRNITITEPSLLTASINGVTNVCPGAFTGSLTANPNGGTAPYTYLWNNGVITQTISNLGAGTYTVTITDANGCTATASSTIIESPNLNLIAEATETVCGSEDLGSANIIVNGGTPPYTYVWSNGDNDNTGENLEEGSYFVTVVDALGCSDVVQFEIDIIDDFGATIIPRDVLCFGEATGSILVNAAGGTPPYTYSWNTGDDSNEITGLTAGSYTVTITEANNCEIIETVFINQPSLLNVSINGTNALCANEANGSAIATVSGGTMPYSYSWSNGMNTPTISNLAPGTYILTVTDGNLCTATASVTISAPSDMSVTATAPIIQCAGTASGSATAFPLGGTPPYTYSWSNGGNTQTISGIIAGIYEVTVTDANGCSSTAGTISVQELPEVTVQFDVFNISCTTQNVGSITANVSGGSGPYIYQWNTGGNTATISGLAAGTYSLTVTDANNCQATAQATVTQTPALVVGANSTNISCFGMNNGTAMAIVNGGTMPFTYSWSNGAETASVSGLAPDTYTVTVTDANDCSGMTTVFISQPPMLNVTTSGQNISCMGGNNGSATAIGSGGTPPYNYQWSNGDVNATATGLTAGTYSVTVTDNNGCTANGSVTLTQPPLLTVNITNVTSTCEGGNAGRATAEVNGGTTPYTYNWSNGMSTATLINVAAGTYQLTVTDALGCTANASVDITNYPQPTCTVNVVQEALMGNDGILQVVAQGGTAPYTYNWSNSANTSTISGLSYGTYTVTVTDGNGCTTTCQATLTAYCGIGDYVWEDIDKDGIQDPNEPAMENILVQLKDAAGNVIDSTRTDANGNYIFLGLTPGTYSVAFETPYGFLLTDLNSGSDTGLDSDADPNMNGMTTPTALEPGEIDLTWDAGMYFMPTVEVGDPCFCLNNSTTEDDGQFSEEITIFSYPGETWTLVSHTGLYLTSSPPPPGVPIPAPFDIPFVEVAPGIYQLNFLLVDDINYNAVFTDGHDTLTYANICQYPTINIVELPVQNLCIWDEDIELNATPQVPGELEFLLNGFPIDVIEPYNLGEGTYNLVVTLTPFDPEECTATVTIDFDVVEDCLSKVGDTVWLDDDHDGIQDPGESGIPGVQVTITGVDEADQTFEETTQTDNTGMYMFWVPPGQYKITFEQPANLNPSPANQGNDDAVDSDMDPNMLMTEVFTIGVNEMDMTWDAGFYSDCENVTDPGDIGPNQYICGPGVDPDPILSLAPATGGVGVLEYVWMMSTESDTFNPQFWTPIPNSNTESYDPGPLFETTYFTRCARREDCVTFIEPSPIVIEVGSEAVAEITGPSYLCTGEEYTFYAVDPSPNAIIEWQFGPGASIQSATGNPVTVSFTSFGNFDIELWVTENGCTSYDVKEVVVSSDPVHCGGSFLIDATVTSEAAREVKISWDMDASFPNYSYDIERSLDGENFEFIKHIEYPMFEMNGIYHFEHEDTAPKMGRTYYRVKVTDGFGDILYSEPDDVIFYNQSSLSMVYPNPVTNELIVELYDDLGSDDIQLELMTVHGKILRVISVPQGADVQKISFADYPTGTYFLRFRYGSSDVRTVKVLKQ